MHRLRTGLFLLLIGSFLLLSPVVVGADSSTPVATQAASTPPATAACTSPGYWSGYWTWDTTKGAWFWTWVWNTCSNGWTLASP